MDLTHPWFLLLLLTLPLLWLVLRGSIAGMTPRQRVACFLVRSLVLVCLILALAGLRILKTSKALSVAFLVDDSASISDEARLDAGKFVTEAIRSRKTGDDALLIGFASHPEVWSNDLAVLDPEHWPARTAKPGANRTAIEKAMTFATAVLNPDKTRRIVLLSDGNDTEDLRPGRVPGASAEVFSVPLKNPDIPEVLVEKLIVPRHVASGEAFDVVARIRGNVNGPARLKLYENQFLVETRDIELTSGTQEIRFPNRTATGNYSTWEAELITAKDTHPENNTARGVVTQRGEPKVLAIDPDPSKLQPFVSALMAEKVRVETRGTEGLPRQIEDLQQYDLLILSDVSALTMDAETMALYRNWVRDFGGGFILTGGEHSFGVGGYFRTVIEQMLPVRMEHDERLDTPTVAMLVVLDRSGSMAAVVAGQTKISLANQGAVLAMQVLQARDLFGVNAVDTRVHQVVPLSKVGDRTGTEQRILSINSGGGGIYVYTALVDAFQQLRAVDAKIKHVILFADAADAEEKAAGEMTGGAPGSGSALDVVTAMLGARITTSVVALGTERDRDADFLRQLSERGNGRFYLTRDALTLPQIFTTETMKVAQSSLVEEPFMAVPSAAAGGSPGQRIIEGIDWSQAPLLLGYNSVKAKPSADILLTTERGDPLFTTWRLGLGQTAAFTSDIKARWASEWLSWPGFGKFWTQTIRGLMRTGDRSGLAVKEEEHGDRLQIEIDAVKPNGTFRNDLIISVTSIEETGNTKTAPAQHVAPGQYMADVPLPDAGTLAISVSGTSSDDGSPVQYDFAHTRRYSPEYLQLPVNESALRDLAQGSSGRFEPKPTDVFARPSSGEFRKKDAREWLLSLALMLIPLDIWLRRRTWKR